MYKNVGICVGPLPTVMNLESLCLCLCLCQAAGKGVRTPQTPQSVLRTTRRVLSVEQDSGRCIEPQKQQVSAAYRVSIFGYYDIARDLLFFRLRYSDIAILHPILPHFPRYRHTYWVARFSALERPNIVYEYRTRSRSFFADIVEQTTISKFWQGFRLWSVLISYTNIVDFPTIS